MLFSHIVLFMFAYPDRRGDVPRRVVDDLTERLRQLEPDDRDHVCNGTLVSREQYLHDIDVLGYEDARLEPRGAMTEHDLEIWTEAIGKK